MIKWAIRSSPGVVGYLPVHYTHLRQLWTIALIGDKPLLQKATVALQYNINKACNLVIGAMPIAIGLGMRSDRLRLCW